MPDVTEGASALADATALADERSNPTITASELAFHGRVWDIRHETFEYNGESVAREFVDHTGAVAILAINDANEVLLIQQYRHPIRMRDWEIPAGLLDIAGEAHLDAAQRELEEEVDLVASDWTELGNFATSPGGSNEMVQIFLARGLSASKTVFDRTEEEADIVKRWVPLDAAVAGVVDGQLRNSILALAVLTAHARG